MSPVTSNIDECVAQLTRESTALDLKVTQALRDGAVKTFQDMGPVKSGGLSPVLTGNYVANMWGNINSAISSRVQKTIMLNGVRLSARKARLVGHKARSKVAIAQLVQNNLQVYKQHENMLLTQFAGKKLADVHSINISNNASHAHLIENGASKKAPQGVFAVEERKALANFNLP